MYLGRFLIVGPDIGAYRVSSRSFPHRKVIQRESALTVGPTDDAPPTDNPYVAYNCLREVSTDDGVIAVFGNGSHIDPIAEKIALGYPPRDALASGLLSLDYEKDDYNTPRIAATIGQQSSSYIGIIRKDALLIESVEEPTLVSTYERDAPEPFEFSPEDAQAAAQSAYELSFDHPVCSLGVQLVDDTVETAIFNGID